MLNIRLVIDSTVIQQVSIKKVGHTILEWTDGIQGNGHLNFQFLIKYISMHALCGF